MALTSTHNVCFEQKYENYQNFSSENFHFLVVKFSIYLNRRIFVMVSACVPSQAGVDLKCSHMLGRHILSWYDSFITGMTRGLI